MVVVAWLAYVSYYLGRVNIAVALPAIKNSLGLSYGQLGLINSVSLLAYALGTIFTSQLGDRMSLRRLIFIGMFVSATLNIVFGSVSTWLGMIIIWAANGFIQSAGWAPMIRTLANWLTPAQSARVSPVFGTSYVVGAIVTWLLTGWLVSRFGWRSGFWIPGGLLMLLALGWIVFARSTPASAGVNLDLGVIDQPLARVNSDSWALISTVQRFWSLMLSAIFTGFVHAALVLWIPTYFVQVGKLDLSRAAILSAAYPLAGFVGIALIGWFVGHFLANQVARALIALHILLAALLALQSHLPGNLAISTAALMFIGVVMFAISSLLLASMPLRIAEREETSRAAGMLDFSYTLGAVLNGVVIGWMLDALTWDVVFSTLSASILIAACFLFITRYRFRGEE